MSLERNKNPKRAAFLKIFFKQLYDLVWHVIFQKYFANIIRVDLFEKRKQSIVFLFTYSRSRKGIN